MFSYAKSLAMQRIRHELALENNNHWDTTEKAIINGGTSTWVEFI